MIIYRGAQPKALCTCLLDSEALETVDHDHESDAAFRQPGADQQEGMMDSGKHARNM